ncbi:MAG: DNA repair protein RecN [Clostridia bacterium]|nr:DNA repair protein RecN [Clostridia bacterium]
MLVQLDIHNIALIDNINIELGKGLNVLTGETGAGKSIIIDSINAILGGRVSKELIRSGKEKATVEAVFHISYERLGDLYENYGIEPEEDGVLIISREFSISGKNICRVNGKMATVSMLREFGERIIDIHGQHDNQSLLRTESHIELLDSFGGEKIFSLKQDYLKVLTQFRNIRSKLKELTGNTGERERKIDLLKFQIDEIKKAKLKTGEDEELNRQRILLSNSERIVSALSSVYDLLFGGSSSKNAASDSIGEAVAELGGISKLDEKYDALSVKLEDISYQLEDIIEEVRKERDNVEYNPELLEQIDERIDLIYKLKRKYGAKIEDIIEYYKKISIELDEIVRSEELIAELHKQLRMTSDSLFDIAGRLHEERKRSACIIEEKISNELNDLEMKRAQFKVSIDFDSTCDEDGCRRFQGNGLDKVEFLISPNAGEPLKPLAKIASGGEMSRIMLGIKTILANVDKMPTLIFDEIDIGISGRAAQKVGEKLSMISGNHQVVCVTHLAQIACMADENYLIEKVSEEESTKTLVTRIEDNALKKEIARILGGASISDITLKHAEEMLENAQKFKQI